MFNIKLFTDTQGSETHLQRDDVIWIKRVLSDQRYRFEISVTRGATPLYIGNGYDFRRSIVLLAFSQSANSTIHQAATLVKDLLTFERLFGTIYPNSDHKDAQEISIRLG